MRFLLAAILLLSGCGLRPAERLDALFNTASDDLHAGELANLLSAADHGMAVAAARRDQVYQWKFRLLRCEVLLYSGRAGEVLNQLRDEVPPAPEFAALAARKMTLVARAVSLLGRADEVDARVSAAHQAAEAAKAEDVYLEALPMPPREADGPPRYWIQDVTLAIAPSLALLAERPVRRGTAPRLLLLGDPVASDSSFPALTHAAGEIASVTRHFGGRDQVMLAREAATPEAYRAAGPGGFSAIHFTAHAVANRESPLDSAVLLSGGKLYAREVMDVPLTADLVTVSACRGVGLRTYSGEGLVGFAWAFLRAGARHVIAGLWDVNDQSTAALMGVLYRELAAGKPPAAALRAAKLSLIASPGNLRKPYYWAPFQLYTVTPEKDQSEPRISATIDPS